MKKFFGVYYSDELKDLQLALVDGMGYGDGECNPGYVHALFDTEGDARAWIELLHAERLLGQRERGSGHPKPSK
jgi:hypothetical protein